MSDSLVSRFISALETLERTGVPEPMLALFEDDASLSNSASERTFEGRRGAREFWRSYRSSFGDIQSRFTRVFESGALAALEWTAQGTLPSGQPIEYGGVTVLELAEDRIRTFRSSFSPIHQEEAAQEGSSGETKPPRGEGPAWTVPADTPY